MMMNSKALFGALCVAARASSATFSRPLVRAFAVTGLCTVALVGCNSVTSQGSGSSSSLGPGGGDGINDAALGVAASPRVTDQQVNLPRGGGRAQVGRPYRIAGRLYTPREDPNYDRTGIASWYGDAFHGRLTANGEVYDMHTLSAAHPTLPLPSYVRVTNLSNDRSVMVRVNDRGPFSHERIIDLSKRAADVLDMRNDGVARVRVEYEGRAPLHGQDVAWLEASATSNGVPLNGGDPNLMLARAPVPAPTPATAPTQTALVATSTAQSASVQPQQSGPASFLGNLFGRPAADVAPVATPTVQPAVTPAFAPASGAPIQLAPPAAGQAFAPVSAPLVPTTPSVGLVPNAPIPAAIVGFMPVELEAGFTQRNQSSITQTNRIAQAHRTVALSALDAASQMALQSGVVQHLRQPTATVELAMQPSEQSQRGRTALVQIGIFGDPANVSRIRSELASLGQVVTSEIRSQGRALTQVRLLAPASGLQAEEALLRTLARQGYTDAYVTQTNNS
ncbi:MAG: septal ring lytic transglycosylase RlpA family protein [Devosiaceae bacterium]